MAVPKAAVLAAIAMVVAAPAAAQSGWTGVGGRRVGGDAGRGTITVRWQAQFREIMFCVEGRAVRLLDADIRFRDGRSQNVRIRSRIPDGGCSRVSAVGRNRDIATVDIAYDPASLEGGRVDVDLFAR